MKNAAAGFDLGEVLKEALVRHQCRHCQFREGAAERLLASPEFAALARRMEEEELECAS
jgi:hypothetical protein